MGAVDPLRKRLAAIDADATSMLKAFQQHDEGMRVPIAQTLPERRRLASGLGRVETKMQQADLDLLGTLDLACGHPPSSAKTIGAERGTSPSLRGVSRDPPTSLPPPAFASAAATLCSHPTAVQSLGRRVESTLRASIDRLERLPSQDGLWSTPYYGGPLHTATSIVALAYAGIPGLTDENRALLSDLLAQQRPDGAWPATAGGPPSTDYSRVVLLALRQALQADGGALATDPAVCSRVQSAMLRCQLFLRREVADDEEFLFGPIVALLWDTVVPEESDEAYNLPGVPALAELLLSHDLAPSVTRYMMAAPAILMEMQAREQGAVARLLARFSNDTLVALGRRLVAEQDPDGGWMVSAFPTALGVMALSRLNAANLGTPADHAAREEAIHKGVAFIRSLRARDGNNTLRESFNRSSAWDTATLLIAMHSDTARMVAAGRRSLSALLHAQLPDGRWSFSAAGTVGDNDSTTMPVKALCLLLPHLPTDEQAQVRGAICRAAKALVDYQQADGGFGAWDKDGLYSFGSRPPSAIGGTINDASVPDVSGRVLASLLAMRRSGALPVDLAARVDRTVARAVKYLRATRTDSGLWWSRWITGHLASAAFVLPPLRQSGIDPSAPILADARRFLLEHQNADGGFGEPVETDRRPELAGRGPSTPAQTAFAIHGLIATARADDPAVGKAMDRAAAYLLRQNHEGQWSNGVPLYTLHVGLEYYDAPEMTSAIVMMALDLYRDYVAGRSDIAAGP